MDDIELLRREFTAAEGSFLLRLRTEYHWDRAAFSRLERAMRRLCAAHESRSQLDRWLVEGYWYLSEYVPGMTGHPDFPRPEPDSYYHAAARRLRDLQNWYVTGRSPYLADYVWRDL
jgi:hypothetical protein